MTILAEMEEANTIHIADVSGKIIYINKMQNHRSHINTSQFTEGIYLWEIRDKNDKILAQGKFNVVK